MKSKGRSQRNEKHSSEAIRGRHLREHGDEAAHEGGGRCLHREGVEQHLRNEKPCEAVRNHEKPCDDAVRRGQSPGRSLIIREGHLRRLGREEQRGGGLGLVSARQLGLALLEPFGTRGRHAFEGGGGGGGGAATARVACRHHRVSHLPKLLGVARRGVGARAAVGVEGAPLGRRPGRTAGTAGRARVGGGVRVVDGVAPAGDAARKGVDEQLAEVVVERVGEELGDLLPSRGGERVDQSRLVALEIALGALLGTALSAAISRW